MSKLRISDAQLLPDVDGSEKIPTGGRGDYAISVDQIKGHIFQDIGKELVGLGNVDNTSDLDKPVSTAQQAALDLKADKTNVYTRTETTLALSQKADLVNGTVPSNQLPSYVDDVVEYTTNTLPIVGESGKIYITTDTNRTWRWSGNQYVEISNGGVSDSTLKLQTPRKIANVDFDGTQNIDIPHNNLKDRDVVGAHPASAIMDDTGKTQQDINNVNRGVETIQELLAIQNPQDGMRVYVKSYYANLIVGGGTFVYNTANTDVYDGGVSFGKWRRRYETLTPQCFGAIGDNTRRFMSSQFATLADAQRHFPHVTDLAVDTLDWAGLQALFNYCKTNIVINANIQGKYYTTKELNYTQGHGALTRKFSGILELIPNASMHHVIRVAGSFLQFDGIIASNPNLAAYRIPYGIFIGGYLDSNSTINSKFGTLQAVGFYVASINVNQNAMFCDFATIRASGGQTGKTTFSNIVHGGVANAQYTEMNLTSIPYHKSEATHRLDTKDFPDPNSWLYIDKTPYMITSVDRVAGTVRIYPQYRGSLTTAEVEWFSGAAFHHGGNNSGCIKVGNISVYGGATGISEVALYTGTYASVTTEFCKIGISLGDNNNDPAMCFNVDRSYFEANAVDYIQVAAYESSAQAFLANAVGLSIDKMFLRNVHAYVQPDNRMNQAATLGSGQYSIGGRALIPSGTGGVFQAFVLNNAARIIELGGLRESRQYGVWGAAPTFNFRVNDKLVEYFGFSELTLILKDPTDGKKAPTAPITFNCPEGYVFDTTGTTSITFGGFTKPPVFYVCVYKGGSTIKRILITCEGLKSDLQANVLSLDSAAKKGTTEQRPTSPVLGQRYYDTTLMATGKPIEWNGTQWVDSAGTTV